MTNNYLLVSILPNLRKVLKYVSYKQISELFDVFFSKYQWGVQKGHAARHYFLSLLEK